MTIFRIRLVIAILLIATIWLGTGCAKKIQPRAEPDSDQSTATTGVAPRPGSQLAYEIELQLSLPAEKIAARLEALRASCQTLSIELSCSLLSIEQQQDRGSIEMRVAPAAVERLTKQASEGGQVEQRKIKAEDLSQAIQDNTLTSQTLILQQEKFKALLARPDLNVSDAITIARELSSLEAAAQVAAKERGVLQRRVETNFLRISFASLPLNTSAPGFWQSFAEEFDGFEQTLAEAISEIILVLVYVLPLIFAMFPVALTWRWLWRWFTGKRRVAVASE